MASFALYSPRLKALEGGYVVDSGGPTNWGITLATLRTYRRNPSLTASDVRALSWTQAAAIYRALYWHALRADQIESQSVAELLVDWKINGWPGLAAIQRLVGSVPDGQMGPKTLAAINAATPGLLHARLWVARKRYYAGLVADNPAKYARYWNGWLKRLNALPFADVAAATSLGLGTILIVGGLAWGISRWSNPKVA